MTFCDVCGADNFEKHDGFMYCSICQTQSQEFHEQQYEFQQGNRSKRQKASSIGHKSKKEKIFDDVFWTSWDTFNCILYGMVQEVKKQVPDANFETLVFKLWAAYLKECKVAFVSRYTEKLPKLSFCFKQCDARILYNVEEFSSLSKTCKKKARKFSSKCSNSSISSYSRKSLAHRKNKVIVSDYEEHLSASNTGISCFTEESLDSLRKSSCEENDNDSASIKKKNLKSYKEMLEENDYELLKKVKKSSKQINQAKQQVARNIKFHGKNKLLSIIHLALLMLGSEIQLGDLLRFIREGHVSFAKVTHFLPEVVKFAKKDSSYIDVVSDSLMPTHLRQRQITCQLAVFLKITTIPTPNMVLLVKRYCHDLNLPEQIVYFCEKILKFYIPDTTTPKSKSLLPSYEAWAIVSIIFIMKFLFGLNDKTELFLSFLARKVNSMESNHQNELFIFEDWQKFLECRKSVLTECHFPTLEQLNINDSKRSDKFLSVLIKESKDEHRCDRFIPYSKYFIPKIVSDGIRQTLDELTQCQDLDLVDFQPSIIPQGTNLKTIFSKNSHEKFQNSKSILEQDFTKCKVEYAFTVGDHFAEIKTKDSFISRVYDLLTDNDSNIFRRNILLDCPSSYWTARLGNIQSEKLEYFKEEIFEKTSENFQWLMTECSRMVEMNVRDVYDELVRIERILGFT